MKNEKENSRDPDLLFFNLPPSTATTNINGKKNIFQYILRTHSLSSVMRAAIESKKFQ